MTTRYLLDTNAASDLVKRREPTRSRAASVSLPSLAISSVTAGELRYGVSRHAQATTLARLVDEFLRYIEILPWTDETARHYGPLRAMMQARGIGIAPLDLMIAAHALSMDATLVTADRALARIEQLRVEDWSA